MSINLNKDEYLPDCYKRSTLILGCGNILFGDDGFGPTLVDSLKKDYTIPEDLYVMDVGTGAREILFTLSLGETKVKKVIIVDAVDFRHLGRKPGEIFEISVDEIPRVKIDDFSMHQIPTSNLLKELKDLGGINVRILVCQVEHIPAEVQPGLSTTVQNAIPEMCELIMSDRDIKRQPDSNP